MSKLNAEQMQKIHPKFKDELASWLEVMEAGTPKRAIHPEQNIWAHVLVVQSVLGTAFGQ